MKGMEFLIKVTFKQKSECAVKFRALIFQEKHQQKNHPCNSDLYSVFGKDTLKGIAYNTIKFSQFFLSFHQHATN